MGPQGFTGEPRAVRELKVVDLREDDLDGQAVDLRAEQAVRSRFSPWRRFWQRRVDGVQVWAENCRAN